MSNKIIISRKIINNNGITNVEAETGAMYDLRIADYPVGTPLVKRGEDWYFDPEAETSFSKDIIQEIIASEQFYYATRGFLSYKNYRRFVSEHKEKCYSMFQSNPYQLLTEDDTIASFSVIDKNTVLSTFQKRLHEMKWAISVVLRSNEKMGHTWMPLSDMKRILFRLLSENGHALSNLNDIDAYLVYFQSELFLDYDRDMIGRRSTFEQEEYICSRVRAMMNYQSFSKFQHVHTDELSEEQNSAVAQLGSGSNIAILTGGPGTGKTSTLKILVNEFKEQFPNVKIAMIAPTGKASIRMKEVFGKEESVSTQTAHMFLGLGVGNRARKKEDLSRIRNTDIIIADESSMFDVSLFYELVSMIREDAKLILVGDINQLPSVEAGNILEDLISLGVKTCYLTTNFRSCKTIHKNAEYINSGRTELEEDDTFRIYPYEFETGMTETQYSKELITKAHSLSPDIILSPFRQQFTKTGKYLPTSSDEINKTIHNLLYPGKPFFYVGEPVLIVKTNYKGNYINGETGFVSKNSIDGSVYANISNEKDIQVQDLYHISLGYGTTVHKSQGSEYDFCAICVPKGCGGFFTRQALYTAVTRAKDKVALIGSIEDIERAIHNNKKKEIRTFLSLFAKEQTLECKPIDTNEFSEFEDLSF